MAVDHEGHAGDTDSQPKQAAHAVRDEAGAEGEGGQAPADGGPARPVVDAVLELQAPEPQVSLRRPTLVERFLERWRGV